MNEYELKPGFMERYRSFYVANGHLTAEQFDAAAKKGAEVQALNLLPGVYWGVTPTITSMYPKLLTSVKLQAQAAGFGYEWKGFEDYTKNVWHPNLRRRTVWEEVEKPPAGQKIGLLFNKLGLITRSQLMQALGLQMLIRDETGLQSRLGVLLMRIANVSVVDLLQVVGIQAGIGYENMDQFVTAYEKQFNSSAMP